MTNEAMIEELAESVKDGWDEEKILDVLHRAGYIKLQKDLVLLQNDGITVVAVNSTAKELLEMKSRYAKIKQERDEYYAQADRLQAKLAQVLMRVDKTKEWMLDRAKIEGAKEFAEKLKKNTHNYYPSIDSYCCSRHVVLVKDIDDILKEYTK